MSTEDLTWQAFEHVANERLEDGRRRLIPVVGSGFNVQATGNVDSWLTLLTDIAQRAQLDQHPTLPLDNSPLSMTALWEQFVSQIAFQQDCKASEAEQLLRKEVQAALTSFEDQSRALPFYDAFVSFGFRDILSLNFDRTLALRHPTRKQVIQHGSSARYPGIKRAPLTRHATLSNGTRVWYPHGDTQARGTIKLGIRDYGVYIGGLEAAFDFFKRDERAHWMQGDPAARRQPWREAVRQQAPGTLTWLALTLTAPILLLGCGMTSDEWPLWGLLHQRRRNLVQETAAERDPVFLLWNTASSGQDERHHAMTQWLRTEPAGVRLLPCSSWPEGWERLFETMSG